MATDELEPVLGTTSNSTFFRRNWSYFYVLCYTVILLSSFAALFHFPFLRLKFGGNCPLYAVPVVKRTSTGEYYLQLEEINSEKTQWGSDTNCNYCFFTLAFSFVISFVWCWFFCFCNTSGNRRDSSIEISVLSANQKWRLIPPATICAIIMWIITLVSSGVMSDGLRIFCSGLRNSTLGSCHNASTAKWRYNTPLGGFYTSASWSLAESWISCSFWLILTLVSLLQCCKGPEEGAAPYMTINVLLVSDYYKVAMGAAILMFEVLGRKVRIKYMKKSGNIIIRGKKTMVL